MTPISDLPEAPEIHPPRHTVVLADPRAVTLLVGPNRRPYKFHVDALKAVSPVFERQTFKSDPSNVDRDHDNQRTYYDLEEPAMTLFQHWITGVRLGGPVDATTQEHYVALYILAYKFNIEFLQNEVMDLIRRYYATHNLTAPASRLTYVYDHTSEPCALRAFLVHTAAFRALVKGEGVGGLPADLRKALGRDEDLMDDFVTALIVLHRDEVDVRRGSACRWHVHERSPRCAEEMAEVWERS